jgi:hypothetical protein
MLMPIDTGNYLHTILEMFYKKNMSDEPPYSFDVKSYNDNIINELFEIVDNVTEKINFNSMKYEIVKLKNTLKF